jgi:uncharacterized protein YdgA (DUF945 family)
MMCDGFPILEMNALNNFKPNTSTLNKFHSFATIVALFFAINTFAQDADFEINNLSYNGLSLKSKKDEIIKKLGKARTNQPKYECGAFSEEEQNSPFYQLVYDHVTFIGNDNGDFVLEKVAFDSKGKTKVTYKNFTLSGRTTKEEFHKYFGKNVVVSPVSDTDASGNSFMLKSYGEEDGFSVTFKDGRLIGMEYWSPC